MHDEDVFCSQCGTENKTDIEKSVTENDAETSVSETKVKKTAESASKLIYLKNTVKKGMQVAIAFCKKYKLIILVSLILIVGIFSAVAIYNSSHCDYGSCNNASVEDSDYCYEHKCSLCDSATYSYYNYCYLHYYLYDDDSPYNTSKMSTDIEISKVTLSSGSCYIYAKGTVTNNGTKTYDYVKIKGVFKNTYGTVIDTDWTYAVGSEGLAPGESKTFQLSVPKDYQIKECVVTLMED